MRRSIAIPTLVLALTCLAAASCDSGGSTPAASATLGPEGGTVEVTDPGSPLHGLRVVVPPGGLSKPTRVTLEAVGSSLPDLPSGVVAFEPAFRLAVGSPLAADVLVTLPYGALPAQRGEVPTALREETGSGTWSLLLPVAVGASSVDVRVAEQGTYRWGFTLLEEASTPTLETAMVEQHGAEQWSEFQTSAETQYETLVVPNLLNPANYTNCDKLNALGQFFVGAYDDATVRLASGLAASCGGCHISFETFLSEVERWIKLQVQHFLVDAIVESCDLDFFIGLLLKFNIDVEYQELANDLSCDYQCLIAAPPPGFWLDLATIYVSSVSMLIVDLSRAQQGCPPI